MFERMWTKNQGPFFPWQDSIKYPSTKEGYKSAWMDTIAEYNNYGFAANNPKYRVDDDAALQLYSFKAIWHKIGMCSKDPQ